MDETPRVTLRQRVAVNFDDGVTGTTTGAGAVNSLVDTARVERDGFWKGGEGSMLSGLASGQSFRVSNSVATGTLTLASSLTQATGNANTYELYKAFSLTQYNNAIDEAVRRAQGNHWVQILWDGLTIVANTYDYAFPTRDRVTVTIVAGSTTTSLKSNNLTHTNNHWKGARVVGRTGTAGNLGQVRNTTASSSSGNTVTLDVALPSTPQVGDTFDLLLPSMKYIYYVEYLASGDTVPTTVPERDYSIVNRYIPYIRFNPQNMPPVGATVRIFGLRYPEPPAHDQDPVELPDDYALNLTYWQLLRSRPKRDDLKTDSDGINRREAWEKATLDLLRNRQAKPASAKRVW